VAPLLHLRQSNHGPHQASIVPACLWCKTEEGKAVMYARWISISLLLCLGDLPAAAQTCKPVLADSDLVAPPKLQMSINPPAAAAIRRREGELRVECRTVREIAAALRAARPHPHGLPG
jgi:hypothetical protein